MSDPSKVEYAAVGGIGVVVIALGTVLRFSSMPPTPRIAAATQQAVAQSLQQLKYGLTYHRALVERDTQQLGIPFDYVQVAEPFPYFLELEKPVTLQSKKDTWSSPHLEIKTSVSSEWAGGGLKTDHVFLSIKNKSRNYLAYRVDTTMPELRRCKDAAQVGHNGIALRPGEEISRVECVFRPGDGVILRRVEVLEIPSISYHYVSRLYPPHVLMDQRVGASHNVAGVKRCSIIPWQEIREAGDAGEASWADVLDFYGRHPCEEYSFFRGYKREPAPRKLPAVPPGK